MRELLHGAYDGQLGLGRQPGAARRRPQRRKRLELDRRAEEVGRVTDSHRIAVGEIRGEAVDHDGLEARTLREPPGGDFANFVAVVLGERGDGLDALFAHQTFRPLDLGDDRSDRAGLDRLDDGTVASALTGLGRQCSERHEQDGS